MIGENGTRLNEAWPCTGNFILLSLESSLTQMAEKADLNTEGVPYN